MERIARLLGGLRDWFWKQPRLAKAEMLVPVLIIAHLLPSYDEFWKGLISWRLYWISRDGPFVATNLSWILFFPVLRPLSSEGLRPQQRWAICGLALMMGILSAREDYGASGFGRSFFGGPEGPLVCAGFWLAAIVVRVWK
jgi:hypothetical protein